MSKDKHHPDKGRPAQVPVKSKHYSETPEIHIVGIPIRFVAAAKDVLRKVGPRDYGDTWISVEWLVGRLDRFPLARAFVRPDAIRLALQELADEGVCELWRPNSDSARVCFRSGGSAAQTKGKPAAQPADRAPADGLTDYRPADWFAAQHGIKQSRLSEAVAKRKVRTRPAPAGQLDSQDHKVRVLYNVDDALRHCSPQHVKDKTRRLFGAGISHTGPAQAVITKLHSYRPR